MASSDITPASAISYDRRRAGRKQWHGCTDHPLYGIWLAMMSRCHKPTDQAFKYYGARGIVVAPEWHDVWQFIQDMGERPEGGTLERIDNALGYSASNCTWATQTAQNRNKRNTKLNMDAATEIRKLRKAGVSLKELQTKYGVSGAAIWKVLANRSWIAHS